MKLRADRKSRLYTGMKNRMKYGLKKAERNALSKLKCLR